MSATQFSVLENLKEYVKKHTPTEAASERQPRGKGGGGAPSNRLPIMFANNCEFTARIVADKNGTLFNEFCQYVIQVPMTNKKGESYNKKTYFRVPDGEINPKTGDMTYYKNDPIWPLVEELKHYTFKPQIYVAVYADILEIRQGANNYLQPGPCILITKGARRPFLKALIQQCIQQGKTPKGQELLTAALCPTEVGITADVKIVGGQDSWATVNFNVLDEPTHQFAPDVLEKINDITTEWCQKFDSENEENGARIMEYYKSMLANMANYASPDEVEPVEPVVIPKQKATPPPPPLPAQKVAKKAPPPPPPPPLDTGSFGDLEAEIDAALSFDDDEE